MSTYDLLSCTAKHNRELYSKSTDIVDGSPLIFKQVVVPITFSGALSFSTTFYFTIIGNIVTVSYSAHEGSILANDAIFTSEDIIPPLFRPSYNVILSVPVIHDSEIINGGVQINDDGGITFYSSISQDNFTTGQVGFPTSSFTYGTLNGIL